MGWVGTSLGTVEGSESFSPYSVPLCSRRTPARDGRDNCRDILAAVPERSANPVEVPRREPRPYARRARRRGRRRDRLPRRRLLRWGLPRTRRGLLPRGLLGRGLPGRRLVRLRLLRPSSNHDAPLARDCGTLPGDIRRRHRRSYARTLLGAQFGHSRGLPNPLHHPEMPVLLSAPGVSRTPDLQVTLRARGSSLGYERTATRLSRFRC